MSLLLPNVFVWPVMTFPWRSLQVYSTAAGANLAPESYGENPPTLISVQLHQLLSSPVELQSDVLVFLPSQWFLRPTQDLAVLRRRQEVISFFTCPQNSDVQSTLQSSLRNIRNIPVTPISSCYQFPWASHLMCLLASFQDRVCGWQSGRKWEGEEWLGGTWEYLTSSDQSHGTYSYFWWSLRVFSLH